MRCKGQRSTFSSVLSHEGNRVRARKPHEGEVRLWRVCVLPEAVCGPLHPNHLENLFKKCSWIPGVGFAWRSRWLFRTYAHFRVQVAAPISILSFTQGLQFHARSEATTLLSLSFKSIAGKCTSQISPSVGKSDCACSSLLWCAWRVGHPILVPASLDPEVVPCSLREVPFSFRVTFGTILNQTLWSYFEAGLLLVGSNSLPLFPWK